MRTIYKYPISPQQEPISIPIESRFLSIQMQNGTPMMWVLVDTNKPKKLFKYKVFGTGWNVSNVGKFLGTFQKEDLVFHVFEAE